MKDEFKLVINKSSKNEFGNYLVDHYTYTYLYDKNKNLGLLIPFEMSIEQIVKDIKELAMDIFREGIYSFIYNRLPCFETKALYVLMTIRNSLQKSFSIPV